MKTEDIRYIVVHCSATRSTVDYPETQLEQDHKARGFKRAGYHFYIRKSGSIIPLRPLDEVGAHVRGHNSHSWGVCYEGGLDATGQPADTRTEAQRRALRLLLIRLHRLAPKSIILGHRDLSPDRDGDGEVEPHEWIKMCPCFDARQAYRSISEGKEVYDA